MALGNNLFDANGRQLGFDVNPSPINEYKGEVEQFPLLPGLTHFSGHDSAGRAGRKSVADLFADFDDAFAPSLQAIQDVADNALAGVSNKLNRSGLENFSGRLQMQQSLEALLYNEDGNARASVFSFRGTTGIPAGKNADLLYFEPHWTLSAGSYAHLLNANFYAGWLSSSSSDARGIVMQGLNEGPGTLTAGYFSAIATPTSTGNLFGIKGRLEPHAGTANAYWMQVALDTPKATPQGVDFFIRAQSTYPVDLAALTASLGHAPSQPEIDAAILRSPTTELNYGIVFDREILIKTAVLQGYSTFDAFGGDIIRWIKADNAGYAVQLKQNGALSLASSIDLTSAESSMTFRNATRTWSLQALNSEIFRLEIGSVGTGFIVDGNRNLGVAGGLANNQAAQRAILIPNGVGPGSAPAAGGVIWAESGALKYRGSGGTVTTIAPA